MTKQFAYLLTWILEILIYQSQLYCCSVCQTEKNRMLRNFRQKRPNQNSEGRQFDSLTWRSEIILSFLVFEFSFFFHTDNNIA